jgi:ABC-type Mn2+/Zn2+ transport system permease subunit
VSLWALLDAAHRPEWAWALAGRRRVVWIVAILFGILTLIGGLLISGYYLVSIRPRVAAAEDGDIR